MSSVSQQQIADHLNLSVATVSRSLRQDPSIPHETRAKVITAASKMGYRSKNPDKLPRTSTGRQSEDPVARSGPTIIIFVQTDDVMADENSYKILAGIGQAAQEEKALLVLHTLPLTKRGAIHRPENQPEILKQAGKVDGAILVNFFEEESVVELAKQTTCIHIAHDHPQARMDCVGIDNAREVAKVVRYLADRGHRHIGYIDAGFSDSFYEERRGGYVLGLLGAGLSYRAEWTGRLAGEPGGDAEALACLHQWIAAGVTGLVCANDMVAVRVYRWLNDHGYRCPDQVSITGFDARSIPRDVPLLTSVRVNFHDLGRLAVERLVQRLKDPVIPPVRMSVECTLVEGQTVRSL